MPSDPFVAVDAALAADQLDRAADLVERVAEGFVAGTEPRSPTLRQLETLLAKLAPVAGRRPWLLYYAAWVASALRQQRLATLTLHRAASAFEATPAARQRERGRILVRLAQGVVAQRDGRFEDARGAFADARALLSSDRSLPEGVHLDDAQRWRRSDPSGAVGFWLDAGATFEAAGEPLALARALHNLSHFALERGEPLAARRLAREACELKRSAGAPHSYAISLNALGMSERVLGYLDAARDNLEEARAVGERCGHRTISAYALTNLGEVAADAGDTAEADAHFERSIAEKLAIADDYALAYGYRAWARGKRLRGDAAAALELAQRAWKLRERTPDQGERAELLAELGGALVACGERDRATAALREAEALALALDSKMTLAAVRLHLARAAGDTELAESSGELIRRWELRCLEHDVRPVRQELGIGDGRGKDPPGNAADQIPLRASVLGSFRLLIDHAEVDSNTWPSRRAAELLRLLVLHHRQPVHADQLLEWLWPTSGPGARRSLNSAITVIRRALDAAGGRREWLRFREDSYQLGPIEWLDLDVFNRLVTCAEEAEMVGRLDLARGRYAHALRLWPHGQPFTEDRYAPWTESTQTSLTRTVQRARERLVALCLELGMLEEAIRQAEEMVLQDPAEENGYRLLIRAHLARDDRSAALMVLRRCEAKLAEYGGPSAGLLALL